MKQQIIFVGKEMKSNVVLIFEKKYLILCTSQFVNL